MTTPYVILRTSRGFEVMTAQMEPVRNGMHQPFIFERREAATAFCVAFDVPYTFGKSVAWETDEFHRENPHSFGCPCGDCTRKFYPGAATA